MHTQEHLVAQIGELQTAVTEMKTAFTSALHQLTSVPSAAADVVLTADNVPSTGAFRDIKTELISTTRSLEQLRQDQESTRRQVQQLLDEHGLLLHELCRTGSLSEEARQQLHYPGLQFPSRTSSGCHSNDSGLGQTADKSAWYGPSDQESSSLTDGPLVSTMVQDYVNGLNGGGDSYDSDSSLTVAINKSLALSTCLSKQCALELDDFSEAETQPLCAGDSEESERVKVVRELVDTERRYCGILWTIQDAFAGPLSTTEIVTEDELRTLFSSDSVRLYEKHCCLLHTLEERLDAWPWKPTVGDVVTRFISQGDSEVLRLYTAYVNDFPQLLSTFYRLSRTSSEFVQFLKRCQHHPGCSGLDLAALLLSPVQRVPRYVLLLQQLLRRTPLQHADHAPLQHALLTLRQFLARLNDSMEQSFQMVHRGAGQNDGRTQRVAARSAGDGAGVSAEPATPTESATSWRRSKPQSSAAKLRLAAGGVSRTTSSGGVETPHRADRGATSARKARRASSEHKPFDCHSLPHIKQRRRAQLTSQLTAARSETNLRERPLSVFEPMQARSAADLSTETSGGGKERLEFRDSALGARSQSDIASPKRTLSKQPKVKEAGSSQTLPRGRTMVVSRPERAVTPEHQQPPASSGESARKVSLRSLKNMFSIKKRTSRYGTLNISTSSRELAVPTGDQYTPLQEASAADQRRPDSTT